MKKKFIAVYALIGVLALGSTTLTSCVDDNESASVTAVRDAKAAQLNALAAQANADASVKEALAALKQAQAEAATIKNEFDQQDYAMKLEKLEAEYAAQIAESQKKQAADEQQILKDLAAYQVSLYNSYNAVQGQVVAVSNEIAQKYVKVAKLESGITSAEAAAKAQLVGLRMDSVALAAEREAYVAMGTNDYQDRLKEYNTELVNQANQENDYKAKEDALEQAKTDFDNAKYQIEGKKDADLNIPGRSGEETLPDEDPTTPAEDDTEVKYDIAPAAGAAAAAAGLKDIYYNEESSNWTIQVLNTETVKPEGYEDTEISFTKYSLNNAGIAQAKKQLEEAVETATANLGKETDAAATWYDANDNGYYDSGDVIGTWTDENKDKKVDEGEVTEGGSAYAIKKCLEDALEDAQDALAKVQEDEDAEESEISSAEEAVYQLQQSLYKFEDGTTEINDLTMKGAEKALADAQADLTEFNGYVASLTAGSTDYTAYEKSIQDLMDNQGAAYVAAEEALNDAAYTLAQTQGRVTALANMVGYWDDKNDNGKEDKGEFVEGTTPNIEKLIADCDKRIAEKNQAIEDAQLIVADVNGDTVEGNEAEYLYQTLIDNANAELDELEAKLAMLQESATYWREQLEASIKGETTVPETPSTDTETPAEDEEAPAA